MANWACTDYIIEGPDEILLKITEAIKYPVVTPGSDETWEGNVLNTLGIKWKGRQPDGSGYYMRGFIQDSENIGFIPGTDKYLSFWAEEAWGATDFNEVLEKAFPDIKVYYCTVEESDAVYATNDREGKYFEYRWHVDTCINGNYLYEDFVDKDSAYKWLSDNTDGKIKNEKDVEEFNSNADVSDTLDEDYISIHEYSVV